MNAKKCVIGGAACATRRRNFLRRRSKVSTSYSGLQVS